MEEVTLDVKQGWGRLETKSPGWGSGDRLGGGWKGMIGLLFGIPSHSPPLNLEFLAPRTGEVGHHRMVIAGASATIHKLMAHSQDVVDPLLSFINKPQTLYINKIH